jgi:hypothetical protein
MGWDYAEETNKVKEPEHCKVRIPGESFWALKTKKPDVVVVNNQLLSDKYNFGDYVRIDKDHNVIGLVKKAPNINFILRYNDSGSEEDIQKRFTDISKCIRDIGGFTEGMVVGCMNVAIPKKKLEAFVGLFQDRLSMRVYTADDK